MSVGQSEQMYYYIIFACCNSGIISAHEISTFMRHRISLLQYLGKLDAIQFALIIMYRAFSISHNKVSK